MPLLMSTGQEVIHHTLEKLLTSNNIAVFAQVPRYINSSSHIGGQQQTELAVFLPMDLEIWHIALTNEYFTSYEVYVDRVIQYKMQIWKCRYTHREKLTYEEALNSEKHELSKSLFNEYPQHILRHVCRIVHNNTFGFEDVVKITTEFFDNHFVLGEEVLCEIERNHLVPVRIGRILLKHRRQFSSSGISVDTHSQLGDFIETTEHVPDYTKQPSVEEVNNTLYEVSVLVSASQLGPFAGDVLVANRMSLIRKEAPVDRTRLLNWLQNNTSIRKTIDGSTIITVIQELCTYFDLPDYFVAMVARSMRNIAELVSPAQYGHHPTTMHSSASPHGVSGAHSINGNDQTNEMMMAHSMATPPFAVPQNVSFSSSADPYTAVPQHNQHYQHFHHTWPQHPQQYYGGYQYIHPHAPFDPLYPYAAAPYNPIHHVDPSLASHPAYPSSTHHISYNQYEHQMNHYPYHPSISGPTPDYPQHSTVPVSSENESAKRTQPDNDVIILSEDDEQERDAPHTNESILERSQQQTKKLKYPIEDLAIERSEWDQCNDKNRPIPRSDFIVQNHLVGHLLMIWNFFHTFRNILRIRRYTFEQLCHVVRNRQENNDMTRIIRGLLLMLLDDRDPALLLYEDDPPISYVCKKIKRIFLLVNRDSDAQRLRYRKNSESIRIILDNQSILALKVFLKMHGFTDENEDEEGIYGDMQDDSDSDLEDENIKGENGQPIPQKAGDDQEAGNENEKTQKQRRVKDNKDSKQRMSSLLEHHSGTNDESDDENMEENDKGTTSDNDDEKGEDSLIDDDTDLSSGMYTKWNTDGFFSLSDDIKVKILLFLTERCMQMGRIRIALEQTVEKRKDIIRQRHFENISALHSHREQMKDLKRQIDTLRIELLKQNGQQQQQREQDLQTEQQQENGVIDIDDTRRALQSIEEQERQVLEEYRSKRIERDDNYQREFSKIQVNTAPLGMDRYMNRYWFLPGFSGVLFVENTSNDAYTMRERALCAHVSPRNFEIFSIETQRQEGMDTDTSNDSVEACQTTEDSAKGDLSSEPIQERPASPSTNDPSSTASKMEEDIFWTSQWSYYSTPEEFDMLVQFLDRRGVRERRLADRLSKHEDEIKKQMRIRLKILDEAPFSDESDLENETEVNMPTEDTETLDNNSNIKSVSDTSYKSDVGEEKEDAKVAPPRRGRGRRTVTQRLKADTVENDPEINSGGDDMKPERQEKRKRGRPSKKEKALSAKTTTTTTATTTTDDEQPAKRKRGQSPNDSFIPTSDEQRSKPRTPRKKLQQSTSSSSSSSETALSSPPIPQRRSQRRRVPKFPSTIDEDLSS